ITREPGEMQIHVMGPLTTGLADTVESLKEIDWAAGAAEHSRQITVRTDTLAAVLARHAAPQRFELMVVDIEGAEKPVVEDLLVSRWRPGVLIVELVDRHPNFGHMPALQREHREVREALAANGYDLFDSDDINSIFRLADHG
ncbi:MAG TPA: FkbM family methyltransferase, partial [Caulobacteraceae bacterium]|nr:FkbM family methyltransferase [Caulobacteraceae bacterium]